MEERQRRVVCSFCWRAVNHKQNPKLVTDLPDKDGNCKQCKQNYKSVILIYSPKNKKWVEVRPRPTDVQSTYKLCDHMKRKDTACPNRAKCTFAHSVEELDEWQRERDSVSTSSRIRKPDVVRSKLCELFAAGKCHRENCPQPHQFKLCDDWLKSEAGYCARDVACPFAHSEKELSTWSNWLTRTPMAERGTDAASNDSAHRCEECSLGFSSSKLLQEHIQSPEHAAMVKQRQIGAKNKFRDPPRGVYGDFRMCRFVASGRRCDFDYSACTFAHSQEEMDYWRSFRTVQEKGGEKDLSSVDSPRSTHSTPSSTPTRAPVSSSTPNSAPLPSPKLGGSSKPSPTVAQLPNSSNANNNSNSGGYNRAVNNVYDSSRSSSAPPLHLGGTSPHPRLGSLDTPSVTSLPTPSQFGLPDLASSISSAPATLSWTQGFVNRASLLAQLDLGTISFADLVRPPSFYSVSLTHSTPASIDGATFIPAVWKFSFQTASQNPAPQPLRIMLVNALDADFSICSVSSLPSSTASPMSFLSSPAEVLFSGLSDDVCVSVGFNAIEVILQQKAVACTSSMQFVLFSFGGEHFAHIVKHVACPPSMRHHLLSDHEAIVSEYRQIRSQKKSSNQRWDLSARAMLFEKNARYPASHAQNGDEQILPFDVTSQNNFDFSRYRSWVHQSLFVEYNARKRALDALSLHHVMLECTESYDTTHGLLNSTAQYSFFRITSDLAIMHLSQHLNVDDLVLVSPDSLSSAPFTGLVAQCSCQSIVIRVSRDVAHLMSEPSRVSLLFSPSWSVYDALHMAVDRVLPRVLAPFASTPTPPSKLTNPPMYPSYLTPEQVNALNAALVTTGMHIIAGPRGSGKTRLVHDLVHLITQRDKHTRILVVHPGDDHVDHLMQSFLSLNSPAVRPYRLFNLARCLQSYVSEGMPSNVSSADVLGPSLLEGRNVICTTVSGSEALLAASLPEGYFTHVIFDDVGLCWEAQALIPLSLASSSTKVLLLGDLNVSSAPSSASPSNTCLSRSYLHRLTEGAGFKIAGSQHVSFLTRSFSMAEPLASFLAGAFSLAVPLTGEPLRETSSTLLGSSLDSNGVGLDLTSSLCPFTRAPLTFVAVHSPQASVDTMLYSDLEAMEVVRQLTLLYQHWPAQWKPLQSRDVGVVVFDPLQAYKIRSLQKIADVDNVEVVLLSEGSLPSYRVLLISAVVNEKSTEGAGILSDGRVLYSALTAAKSYVMVVGDAFALCAIGQNGLIWSSYINKCREHNSFFISRVSSFQERLNEFTRWRRVLIEMSQLESTLIDEEDLSLKKSSSLDIPSRRHSGEYTLMLSSNPWGDETTSTSGSLLGHSWTSNMIAPSPRDSFYGMSNETGSLNFGLGPTPITPPVRPLLQTLRQNTNSQLALLLAPFEFNSQNAVDTLLRVDPVMPHVITQLADSLSLHIKKPSATQFAVLSAQQTALLDHFDYLQRRYAEVPPHSALAAQILLQMEVHRGQMKLLNLQHALLSSESDLLSNSKPIRTQTPLSDIMWNLELDPHPRQSSSDMHPSPSLNGFLPSPYSPRFGNN